MNNTGALSQEETITRFVPPQASYATIITLYLFTQSPQEVAQINNKPAVFLLGIQQWQGIDYTHSRTGYLWHDGSTLGFVEPGNPPLTFSLNAITALQHQLGLIISTSDQAYLLYSPVPIKRPDGFVFHPAPSGINFSTSMGGWLDEFILLGKIDAAEVAEQKQQSIKYIIIFLIVAFTILFVVFLLTN